MKACIIGVSGYGDVHYNMLMKEHAAGNVEIAGATIINQNEEAEKCAHLRETGCRIFDNYEEMLHELTGKAQLCMIPTGIPLHKPMAIAAVEAGMHVFLEKPVAGCIHDAYAMQEAASSADRFVSVGYQHMHAPAAIQAKRAILEKKIGDVRIIKNSVMWPRSSIYYGRNKWAGKLRVGNSWVLDSPFNNAVSHDVMMMLFLAGPSELEAATPISIEAELYRANDIESCDTACIRVETNTGITVLLYCTHACQALKNPVIHVCGTKGTVFSQHGKASIALASADRKELAAGTVDECNARMMQSVLKMAQGQPSAICSLEMATKQTLAMSAVNQVCKIHNVPGKTRRNDDGSTTAFIPGIEEVIEEALTGEKMFNQCNAPWAKPSATMSCEGYREFSK